MTYKEQLKDPRWIAKRTEIVKRDKVCQRCDSKKRLEVHHIIYISGRLAWEYENDLLILLCKRCHTIETINRKKLYKLLNEMLTSGFMSDEIIERIGNYKFQIFRKK